MVIGALKRRIAYAPGKKQAKGRRGRRRAAAAVEARYAANKIKKRQ
jgi:hypothetical protein